MTDPLNINVSLAGVETSLPLLPEGDYTFQVVESAVGTNKDQNGLNWSLKLALTTPAVAVDGREIQPNFPVYHTLALQAKEGSKDVDAFRRSLGEAVDAMFGTDKTNRPDFNQALVGESVGKLVLAHIYIDEWQGKNSNKIKRLKAVTA